MTKTKWRRCRDLDKEPDCMPDVVGAVMAIQRGDLRVARLCNKEPRVARSLDDATLDNEYTISYDSNTNE